MFHCTIGSQTPPNNTHHGYSYPPYSHLSSHWVRPLQPSTAHTHCPTASYPLQHSTTLYSLQLYSISTVYNLYNTPLAIRPWRLRSPARGSLRTRAQMWVLVVHAHTQLACHAVRPWKQNLLYRSPPGAETKGSRADGGGEAVSRHLTGEQHRLLACRDRRRHGREPETEFPGGRHESKEMRHTWVSIGDCLQRAHSCLSTRISTRP